MLANQSSFKLEGLQTGHGTVQGLVGAVEDLSGNKIRDNEVLDLVRLESVSDKLGGHLGLGEQGKAKHEEDLEDTHDCLSMLVIE